MINRAHIGRAFNSSDARCRRRAPFLQSEKCPGMPVLGQRIRAVTGANRCELFKVMTQFLSLIQLSRSHSSYQYLWVLLFVFLSYINLSIDSFGFCTAFDSCI